MQRVIRISGGFNGYQKIADPAELDGADECPFCDDHHRLRRHGWYTRQAVMRETTEQVRLRRLLCFMTGLTVSLFPDFLLPRKQHAVEVVACFLVGFLFDGCSLNAAMVAVTLIYPSRQKAAYWCRCIVEKAAEIRAYTARLFHRVSISTGRRCTHLRQLGAGGQKCCCVQIAGLLQPLAEGFSSLDEAIVFHGRQFHQRFKMSII